MKSALIAADRIIVPDFVERPLSKVADDRDRRSIEAHGIQQPLVLVADGARLLLAKGLRRLRIAKSLGLGKVPYVEAPVPKGYTPEDYVRELRLALDMHRADLLPSQKCALVEDLKQRFSMQNKQLAAYLGIDQDSVTNWLAVRNYIPEVVVALDRERMTMGAARVFDGMSEKGQQAVWKKHSEELSGSGKAGVHKHIRKLYPPASFPAFYRQPELVASRLARKATKRKAKGAPTITSNEKRRMMSSVELKSIELSEGQGDLKKMETEIQAAIAPIAAIMRAEKLWALVPEDMRPEIERFAEVFI